MRKEIDTDSYLILCCFNQWELDQPNRLSLKDCSRSTGLEAVCKVGEWLDLIHRDEINTIGWRPTPKLLDLMMHDAIMIKHAYIEILTDRCMKLAKAGLIDQWPHVSEQDVRNTLAGGYSPVVVQKREMSKMKYRLPKLSAEQERALLLLYELPHGLTEEQLLACGITKETLDSLM